VPVLSWIIKSPTGTIVSEQKNWKENIEAEASKPDRFISGLDA
jgi:hypothetical protein